MKKDTAVGDLFNYWLKYILSWCKKLRLVLILARKLLLLILIFS